MLSAPSAARSSAAATDRSLAFIMRWQSGTRVCSASSIGHRTDTTSALSAQACEIVELAAVVQPLGAALVRHVQKLHAGGLGKQLHRQMAEVADPGGGIGQRRGLRLGERD